MKVILLEDVKKVGKKNDIVEVSQGYFNNVLKKDNLAIECTKGNKKHLDLQLAKQAHDQASLYEKHQALKTKLEQEKIILPLQKGANGSAFGSITAKQICDKLQTLGYDIDKKDVKMDKITTFGQHDVKIELQKDVIVNLNVYVEEK